MISQSCISSAQIFGLILVSLSIHVRYSSKASATQFASHHSCNLNFAYFIALRSNGSVSLAQINICVAFSKKFSNSFWFFIFASRNSFIIILHACLAISVAHWIMISLISFAIFSTFFKFAILFLFDINCSYYNQKY